MLLLQVRVGGPEDHGVGEEDDSAELGPHDDAGSLGRGGGGREVAARGDREHDQLVPGPARTTGTGLALVSHADL